MVNYCSNCWKEITKEITICPNCGADQNKLEKEIYIDKLIRALDHPEPETPIRAANVLAQLNLKKAVPFLIKKLKREKDPFIIKAIVDALVKIDLSGTKSEIIKILSQNTPVTVKNLLKKL